MARPVYSLGSFTFVSFSARGGRGDGAPMLPQTHSEIVQRPNVKGTGLVRFERMGDPFVMDSFVDLANDTSVPQLMTDYVLSVAQDPLAMVWRDFDYFTLFRVKFLVLAVTDMRSKWFLSASGGLNPPSRSSLMATWHLLPVEVQN